MCEGIAFPKTNEKALLWSFYVDFVPNFQQFVTPK